MHSVKEITIHSKKKNDHGKTGGIKCQGLDFIRYFLAFVSNF